MKKTGDNLGQRPHRGPSSREQTFDSAGPEGKVRGTAKQLFEKYLALGRDAMSSSDRMMAERFFQYAEHYRRAMWEKEANAGTTFSPKKRPFPPQARQSRPESLPSERAEKEESFAAASKRPAVRQTTRKPKANPDSDA